MGFEWLRAFTVTPPGPLRLLVQYVGCLAVMVSVAVLYPSILAIALAWVALALAFWFMVESARFAWLVYLLYGGWVVISVSVAIVALILVVSVIGVSREMESVHLLTTPLFWAFLGWSVGGMFALLFERFSEMESLSEGI